MPPVFYGSSERPARHEKVSKRDYRNSHSALRSDPLARFAPQSFSSISSKRQPHWKEKRISLLPPRTQPCHCMGAADISSTPNRRDLALGAWNPNSGPEQSSGRPFLRSTRIARKRRKRRPRPAEPANASE